MSAVRQPSSGAAAAVLPAPTRGTNAIAATSTRHARLITASPRLVPPDGPSVASVSRSEVFASVVSHPVDFKCVAIFWYSDPADTDRDRARQPDRNGEVMSRPDRAVANDPSRRVGWTGNEIAQTVDPASRLAHNDHCRQTVGVRQVGRQIAETRKVSSIRKCKLSIVKSCGWLREQLQAATFSPVIVSSLVSSVTRMPSLNVAPASTSATSSWPLKRRQRSCAASSSL